MDKPSRVLRVVAVGTLLLGMTMLWSSSSAHAQAWEVSGTVVDSTEGTPLPGVNVVVKGTTRGTATDAEGRYQLSVPSPRDTLLFSFVGYRSEATPIAGRSTLDVRLSMQVLTGEEVVVVGYGTQRREDLSSAIASVEPAQIQANAVFGNPAAALQGTTPGVSATMSSGAPGAGVNIRIRGSNSFGNNSPLVIIDGVPGDLTAVAPEDVASIQVLKDAAAAAIYGSRAANGVILVSTEQGNTDGGVDVTLHSSYSVQRPTNFIPAANAEQYARINNALHRSAGIPIFEALADPVSLGEGTDWQRALYSSAPMWRGYMSISTGNEYSTYRVSGAYSRREGIMTQTWYRQAQLHFNGRQAVGPFTFGQSVSWTREHQRTQPPGGAPDSPLISQTLKAQPIYSVYDSTQRGGFGGAPSFLSTQATNPVGYQILHQYKYQNNQLQASVYGEVSLLRHFQYRLNVGYTSWDGYDYEYAPGYFFSTQRKNLRADLTEDRGRSHHWVVENTLNYEQQFGAHNVDLLAGFTLEEDVQRSTWAFMEGFPSNDLRVIGAGTGYATDVGGGEWRWAQRSLLARAIYSYAERYYVTATVRNDGSSRFGGPNRYGTFPSASVAWRVSEEAFFEPLTSVVNSLKLRASYGVLGNLPTNNYAYIPTITYGPGLGYLFGGSLQSGAAIESFANPQVKWETTRSTNVGLDARLFGRVELHANYFLSKTSDVLLRRPIPPSTGTSEAPIVNTGRIQNQGVELALMYDSPTYENSFQYSVAANVTTVHNEVTKLGYAGEVIWGSAPYRSIPVTAAQKGYPIGAFFALQADGLFQNQEEINNWTSEEGEVLQPNAQPGDVRYVDVNGDGTINTSDVAYSGSPIPTLTYGLNVNATYRNFDFTLFVEGNYGNEKVDANTWLGMRGTTDYNYHVALLDAWTPKNRDTYVPRLTFNDPNHNSYPSTRFLYDASYLRFKTVQLGYSMPDALIGPMGLTRLRAYVSAHNLWTITGYPGYDPSYTSDGLLDRGLDQSIYPLARTFTVGVQLAF